MVKMINYPLGTKENTLENKQRDNIYIEIQFKVWNE